MIEFEMIKMDSFPHLGQIMLCSQSQYDIDIEYEYSYNASDWNLGPNTEFEKPRSWNSCKCSRYVYIYRCTTVNWSILAFIHTGMYLSFIHSYIYACYNEESSMTLQQSNQMGFKGTISRSSLECKLTSLP